MVTQLIIPFSKPFADLSSSSVLSSQIRSHTVLGDVSPGNFHASSVLLTRYIFALQASRPQSLGVLYNLSTKDDALFLLERSIHDSRYGFGWPVLVSRSLVGRGVSRSSLFDRLKTPSTDNFDEARTTDTDIIQEPRMTWPGSVVRATLMAMSLTDLHGFLLF